MIGQIISLTSLTVCDCPIVDAGVFVRLQLLTALNLSGCNQVGVDCLASVGQLPSLTHLVLDRCQMVERIGLGHLKSLRLRSLSLRDCQGVHSLSDIPCPQFIESLDLHRCRLANPPSPAERHSVSLSVDGGTFLSLARLDLSCCRSLSPGSLAVLRRAPHLASLSLAGCDTVDADLLECVGTLPSLTCLVLDDCLGVDAAGLGSVTRRGLIRNLSLKRCATVYRACFIKLLNSRGCLTSLCLAGCRLVDTQCVSTVAQLSNLTSLDLSGCRGVRGHVIRRLVVGLRCLVSLDLSGCSLSDDALELIASLPMLTSLSLGCNTAVEFGELGHVSFPPQLVHFSLARSDALNKAILVAVGRLQLLTTLDLRHCALAYGRDVKVHLTSPVLEIVRLSRSIQSFLVLPSPVSCRVVVDA